MVERNVGQMSLADGLVQAPRSSILDEVEGCPTVREDGPERISHASRNLRVEWGSDD